MLDALLAAIPDQAYFEQRDFGFSMRDTLLAADEPFGCHLRGAKVWETAKQAAYPFYSLCKDNSEHNISFGLYGTNTLVLSSAETGELIMLPMGDFSGKIPLPDDHKANPSPRSAPLVKTFSVDETWRAISARDLSGGRGGYQAFLHAGNFQSVSFGFRVLPSGEESQESPFESRLRSHADSEPRARSVPHVRFDPIPGLKPPSDPGLVFRAGKPSMRKGSARLLIEGAFRFRGTWKKDWVRLPLYIMTAVAGDPAPGAYAIWLPRGKMTYTDARDSAGGTYSGSFAFNLTDLFIAFPGQKPRLPDSAWISFVHRDWQGPITGIGFGKD